MQTREWIGVPIVSPRVARFEFSFPILSVATNNQVKYEAVHKGLQLLYETGAKSV